LYTAGFKKKDQKKLNHDLVKALNVAEDNGLNAHIVIEASERDALEKANRLYPKKEFEYFESLQTIYDPHDFDLEVLASFAQRLLDAIESPVRDSISVERGVSGSISCTLGCTCRLAAIHLYRKPYRRKLHENYFIH
jgi:hypothetical protein